MENPNQEKQMLVIPAELMDEIMQNLSEQPYKTVAQIMAKAYQTVKPLEDKQK